VEHREAELSQVEPGDGPAEDPARFLRELRQLRDGTGLGQAELAARAHYPCEAIQAAEAGPGLPDLPVLSAYVRSCGGVVAEWEERWRRLTRSPAMPLLPVRTAGCSGAATAGARIGSASLAADTHDPALIMAALSRVANGITAEPAPRPPSALPRSPLSAPPLLPEPASAPDATATAEPGSLFSAPEPASAPRTAAQASGAVPPPEILLAPVAYAGLGTNAVPSARSAARGTATPKSGAPGPQAPSAASPLLVSRGAAHTRRPLPPKPLIAAAAIVLCLLVVLLALFS
jgi:hypothetical protein